MIIGSIYLVSNMTIMLTLNFIDFQQYKSNKHEYDKK